MSSGKFDVNESLRGQVAHFEAKAKEVKSRSLPEWSDELAKSLERALQAEVELRYPSAIEMLQSINRAVGLRRRSGCSMSRMSSRDQWKW